MWRYQSGNQNPYIEEEQTTQWQKEKIQKDKQGSIIVSVFASNETNREFAPQCGQTNMLLLCI